MYRRNNIVYVCGCWYINHSANYPSKQYLPQVQIDSRTTILATTSRTTLQQTFHNPLKETIKEATYTFPLYDGVSVAGFTCTVGDRVIVGIVKEKNQARTDFNEAVSKGEVAGLFEQNPDAADVFTTSIGNIPAGENVLVEITYLGELKNDAETDGARFTIPTKIAPRYGQESLKLEKGLPASCSGKMNITVDIALEEGCAIRGIQSPSHPISVTLGKVSAKADDMDDDSFDNNLGSATLSLNGTELDKDFVIIVAAKGQDTPRALLETHPTIANQRAILTTLVPKFNIPNDNPEIVFVVDRSGSMEGKMHLVIEALKVFLKSLPVSVKFNICSFGSMHNMLFDRSKTYDANSLEQAMKYIEPGRFMADLGGTEMLRPINSVLEKRYKDLPLEVMLLTDGEIWNQDQLFEVVNEASKQNARFFTLGIGSQASTSLVEGIARSGRGFAQWVYDGERIDKRIVRMLKAALSPHIQYKLEVKYSQDSTDDEDFELVESFEKSMKTITQGEPKAEPAKPRKISLFSSKSEDQPTNPTAGRYDHLPTLSVPHVLQTPHVLPELYPHSRTSIYLLLGPDTQGRTPQMIVLRGKTTHGDLELEIPVQDIGQGKTIHQLAAKKATQELEEGRGWLTAVVGTKGKTLQSQNEGRWDLIVEREAVRLGTTFQVAGRFCSFVAVRSNKTDKSDNSEIVTDAPPLYDESRYLDQNASSNSMRFDQMQSRAAMMSSSGGGIYRSSSPASSSRGSFFGNFLARSNNRLRVSTTTSSAPPPPPPSERLSSSTYSMAYAAPQAMMQQQAVPQAMAYREPIFGARPSAPSAPGAAAFSFGAAAPSPGSGQVNARRRFHAPASKEKEKKATKSISRKRESSDEEDESADALFADSEQRLEATYSPSGNSHGPGMSMGSGFGAPTIGGSQPVSKSRLDKMQELISLQTFLGSWTASDELLAIISHDAKKQFASTLSDTRSMEKHFIDLGHGPWIQKLTTDDCVTTLVIAWLETVVEDEKDVWEMVVEKARAFLASQIDGRDHVDEVVDSVRTIWEI